jgi:hypothetical protein
MSSPQLHMCAPPAVSAFLERSRDGLYWRWVVRACALCGASHIHGGGQVGKDDPRRLLSHRVAHCRGHVPDGYVLQDSDPPRTARILQETLR